MEWDRHHRNLLIKLFEDKWNRMRCDYEDWYDYLKENRICGMGLNSVASSWEAGDSYVCIENPIEDEIKRNPYNIAKVVGFSTKFDRTNLENNIWYLVPKEFAEEALEKRRLP